MKAYPSIRGSRKHIGQPCVAFYKYDGSNLRFEWSKKRGWHKYGTRRRLFDEADTMYGPAITTFKETLAEDIEKVACDEYKNENVIAFTEFFGSKSFAGQHDLTETKKLALFDINIHKKGLISPMEFVKNFCHLEHAAKVIYEGNLNQTFVDDVRNGKYDLNEGVVAKGGTGHKMWMCKIKTHAYLERLKEVFADGWKQYWEDM